MSELHAVGMIKTMSESNGHGASGTKHMYRRRDGRLIAGVCAGVAAYFGVDVTLVRLGFAIFTIFWGLGRPAVPHRLGGHPRGG